MDVVSNKRRSEIMRAVKRANTKPEMIVRKIAHGLGARYRLHDRKLPGSPDVVFVSRKICLFVHGCFWHRHEGCRLASIPSSNCEFWSKKFLRNMERDSRNEELLRDLGWRVEVVWQCETRSQENLTARLGAILFPSK
ncbi:very short patch repair endonuclease [Xanthomonas axonopodis pv. fascicularis]|uniref:very short patch repair endonuclease n=1 Tax=Xanthomonas axonopodis TaxID=53413 RepID=UPI0035317CDD